MSSGVVSLLSSPTKMLITVVVGAALAAILGHDFAQAIKRTCDDHVVAFSEQLGVDFDGEFRIQPDGVDPFTVYCDFNKNITTGADSHLAVTYVFPKKRRDKPWCRRITMSSETTFEYDGVSLEQIRALVAASDKCDQFVRLECLNSSFSFGAANGYASYWIGNGYDRTFSPEFRRTYQYWGGASSLSQNTDNRCSSGVCNCQTPSGTWAADEGYLVNEPTFADIPVTVVKLANINEIAHLVVGPLRCWKNATVQPVDDDVFDGGENCHEKDKPVPVPPTPVPALSDKDRLVLALSLPVCLMAVILGGWALKTFTDSSDETLTDEGLKHLNIEDELPPYDDRYQPEYDDGQYDDGQYDDGQYDDGQYDDAQGQMQDGQEQVNLQMGATGQSVV